MFFLIWVILTSRTFTAGHAAQATQPSEWRESGSNQGIQPTAALSSKAGVVPEQTADDFGGDSEHLRPRRSTYLPTEAKAGTVKLNSIDSAAPALAPDVIQALNASDKERQEAILEYVALEPENTTTAQAPSLNPNMSRNLETPKIVDDDPCMGEDKILKNRCIVCLDAKFITKPLTPEEECNRMRLSQKAMPAWALACGHTLFGIAILATCGILIAGYIQRNRIAREEDNEASDPELGARRAFAAHARTNATRVRQPHGTGRVSRGSALNGSASFISRPSNGTSQSAASATALV